MLSDKEPIIIPGRGCKFATGHPNRGYRLRVGLNKQIDIKSWIGHAKIHRHTGLGN